MLDFDLSIWLIVIILYTFIFIKLIKSKANVQRHILILVFYIYICLIIKETFFPISLDFSIYRETASGVNLNLQPFKTINEILSLKGQFASIVMYQIYGNLLLLFPLGYLLPLAFTKINNFKKVILTSLLITLAIELLQLILSLVFGYAYRAVDIDDIMLNTVGAIVGYIAFLLTKPILIKLQSYTK